MFIFNTPSNSLFKSKSTYQKLICLGILIICFCPSILMAQLTGKVTDAKGEPLPSANVYIEGTTRGTSANTEGYYSLDLENGTYRMVYQSIGYKKKIETVKIDGKTVKNIQLDNTDIELSEFVVKSNAEDPAYAIIRKAIEMRKVYRDQAPAYSCDVYIKGVQKIVDAPKKFLGRDMGDMGGTLDTVSRSGILYLSETISKYFVDGNKKKEELVSSKLSGSDNGFGFNRASLFDFSFYDNSMDIGRQILSPIADNALTYYKYHLVGTFKDDQGNTVNKIEVLPKRKEDPTWAGFIYIVDNQWNIYSSDLYVTGKSIQQPILDSLFIRQTHVQVDKTWRLFSQVVDFKLKIFALKIKGDFTGVYSNYNMTPQYEKRFFNNETFKATRGKDDNNLSKWDTLRPIPLTLEEKNDYIKKDSLQKVRQSKVYIDSVEQINNKFKFMKLFTGYTYSDTWNRQSFSVASPLSTFTFNAVQGGNIALKMTYSKRFGERFKPSKQSFSLTPSVSYGFAEKKLRANVSTSYYFNRFNDAQIKLEGGQKVEQYNDENPVTIMAGEIQALYYKRHYFQLYDKKYAKLTYSQELINGLKALLSFETAQRSALNVNSQYSFIKKGEIYNSNIPENIYNPTGIKWTGLENAHILKIGLTWVPAQKYSTYPDYKEIEGSDYPTFSILYKKALKIGQNSVDYDAIQLKIEKENIRMGIAGYSEIKAQYGSFLSKNAIQFIDYNHFNGNQTIFSTNINFMNGFLSLPYYQYSNPNSYFMAHWQHHLEGFIFDKIPLVRKLGFKEIVRVAYLNTPDLKNYVEMGFGIDNIGWGIFRFIRTDMNWTYLNGNFNSKPNFMIGIKILN